MQIGIKAQSADPANYDWKNDIDKVRYVDVLDEYGRWNLGVIEEYQDNGTRVKVHYDGWFDKYDRIFPIGTDLIAPIRLYSRGYTGAKTQNQRESFIYIEDDVKNNIAKLRNFIINLGDFTKFTAFEFTHFVRAELFVLIDSLLTTNFLIKYDQNIPIEDRELRTILELCDAYCKLYVKWLSILPKIYGSVFFHEAKYYIVFRCY